MNLLENAELREKIASKMRLVISHEFEEGKPYRVETVQSALLKAGVPWYVFESEYHILHTRAMVYDKSITLSDLLMTVYMSHYILERRRNVTSGYFECRYSVNTDTGMIDCYDERNCVVFYNKKREAYFNKKLRRGGV